ncbi:TauD/TfdA dioxygenase family protein [Enterovibrio coralii]|uniref:Taurine catabolism dioxygenase n=1 Tax=Enterovibrio coralii TaxID=294935 RepID=A0A135I967_9GAMM|nr:TauD/TfdA family dioxygenase [Enterovibrio coralii]KXF81999.1 taurine catabolism dioxygenase [Enterovibrio coralii]
MRITPINTTIGALVEDVDLAQLSDEDFDLIYQAFLKHKVIFFRRQTLTAAEHLSLARRFGELEAPHPFFPHVEDYPQVSKIETMRGNPPGKSFWHTDMTWQSAPPKCSILAAQYLPDAGGDTIWLSMEAVYHSLPAPLKHRIRGQMAKHAVHGFAGSRFDHQDESGESRVDQISQYIDAVSHPLVAEHEETGNPTLFINEQFTRFVEGESADESEALLATLFSHCRDETLQVRFKWEEGSVAIWDNRCTQHFAVTDYGDTPRLLHRVVVKGTQPRLFTS